MKSQHEALIWWNWCPSRKRKGQQLSLSRVRTQQEGDLLEAGKKALIRTPCWSLTTSLQNYEKISFCCLKHPVCGKGYGNSDRLRQWDSCFFCYYLFLAFFSNISSLRTLDFLTIQLTVCPAITPNLGFEMLAVPLTASNIVLCAEEHLKVSYIYQSSYEGAHPACQAPLH